MRVPLGWLKDYVDFELSPEELAQRLTMVGMEVQSIERWGSDWQNVVVGELLSVAPHPRADRLIHRPPNRSLGCPSVRDACPLSR